MTQININNHYTLGDYLITYRHDIQVETFACEWYHGIIFFMEDGKYELINNYHMGTRIIINPNTGGCREIPFKPATFWFLPPGVEATEIPKG